MFYLFSQNNSGGHFHRNNKVDNYVVIEALTLSEAVERARAVGIYFDGCAAEIDCPCCGDRWYRPYSDEGAAVPSVYGEEITADEMRWTPNAQTSKVIHFANGVVKYA